MRRLLVGLAIAGIAFLSPLAAIADDDQIAQQIVSKLESHQKRGELKGFDLDLIVDNGKVVLKGQVSSKAQEQLALKATEGIEGVTKVMNDLVVKKAQKAVPVALAATRKKPQVSPVSKLSGVAPAMHRTVAARKDSTDELLLGRVASALRQQKSQGNLKDFNVNLTVSKGVVWLKGRVASRQQQAFVVKLCKDIKGVQRVVNRMEIIESATKLMVKTVSLQTPPKPVIGDPSPAPRVAQRPIVPSQPRPLQVAPRSQQPLAFARSMGMQQGRPMPAQNHQATFGGMQQVRYDHANMPNYAWPSYAAYPNYGAVTYPKQYSPTAWPYIGPFYPYPQVPLGWRSVTLEWDDGWWFLDFRARRNFRHRSHRHH